MLHLENRMEIEEARGDKMAEVRSGAIHADTRPLAGEARDGPVLAVTVAIWARTLFTLGPEVAVNPHFRYQVYRG